MANKSGFPSLTALLGLIAVAGFQNRYKIAEMLRGGRSSSAGQLQPQQGLGDLLSGFKNTGAGGLLSGGLGELLNKFKQAGLGDTADSWVKTGSNKLTSSQDLEAVLGPGIIQELEVKTGLSRKEILARLEKQLPDAVDRYTPDGRLPAV